MSVLLQDSVTRCLTEGEPLHLPGCVSFDAVTRWRWEDGLQRIHDLASDACVQVHPNRTEEL